MPELPEVETVVRDLNKKIKGRKITAVWFDWPKHIKDPTPEQSTVRGWRSPQAHKNPQQFVKDIIGSKILEAKRRGKNILIYLSGDKVLLIHQKMTGHLLIGKWQIAKGKVKAIEPKAIVEDSYNGFIHIIFTLDNDKQLALSDVRKFAKVILGSTKQIEGLDELAQLGPDALDSRLTLSTFSEHVKRKASTVKQALLDQTVIAGIGNIYSDDMLWRAQIHPLRKPSTLSNYEIKKLYQDMREVLTKAVEMRGTSTSDFRDTSGLEGGYTEHRLVYQREGEPCQRCKTPIKRITVGGRSAHFCPRCQQKPHG